MKNFARCFICTLVLTTALAAAFVNASDYVIPDYDGPGFSITIAPPNEDSGNPPPDNSRDLQIRINPQESNPNHPRQNDRRHDNHHEKAKRRHADHREQTPPQHFGKKTGAYQSGPHEISGVRIVDINSGKIMPIDTVDIKPTLDRIEAGIKNPHRNDGSIFRNFSSHLPRKSRNYYREYVVPTPGIRGPGPQRLIIGQEGEIYYTFDHYDSFIKVEKE